MRLTATEELVIKRKRSEKYYWREASDWYWLCKLFQEMVELIRAVLGIHQHTVSHELEQIAAMCMNWIETRRR